MIECGGVYLPDGETHLVEWMTKKAQWVDGRLTYQLDKQRLAIAHVTGLRVAVDIGAHVGLWSMQLIKRFKFVYAFEPVARHRECFEKNLESARRDRVFLLPYALGESNADVSIYTAPTSSGDSWVSGSGDIPMRTLDSFNLDRVDFIKADCEGYELFALRGGEATILRNKPVICVEQKPGKAQQFGLGETDAVKWLESLGATVRRVISGDYILTF